MPPEFQKIMYKILLEKDRTIAFLDNILIATKGEKRKFEGSERSNQSTGQCWNSPKIGEVQDREKKTEWLGFKLSKGGIKPVDKKVQALTEKLHPRNLKDLRSIMGAINQMNKFIPNLANLSALL